MRKLWLPPEKRIWTPERLECSMLALGLGLGIPFGGGYVTPLTIFGAASVALWLRADLGITLNGGNVSAWADQSRSGDANKNVTQGTAGNQPVYTAVDAAYRNQPTLSNAATRFLQSAAWAAALNQVNASYVVGNDDGTATNQVLLDGIAASPRQLVETNDTVVGPDIFAGTVLGSGVARSSSPCVFGALWNGASSKVYVSALTASATGPANTQGITGTTVMANFAGGANLIGKVAEVVIINRAPTASEHAALMTYLGSRYGIAIGA